MNRQQCTCTPPVFDLNCPVHSEAVGNLLVEAIDNDRVIQAQPPGRCELCGAVDETRPYGPNGEEICFACGEKDPETTKAKFMERFG